MADAAVKPGSIHRIYYYAAAFAGADAAAVKAEIAAGGVRFDDILSDAKLSQTRDTADIKERGRDFKLKLIGGRVIGFTAKITCRPGHTVYDALDAAFAANTVIGILLTDGDKATAGTKCVAMNCQIEEWSQDQPDPGAATHDFAVGPSALSAFGAASVVIS